MFGPPPQLLILTTGYLALPGLPISVPLTSMLSMTAAPSSSKTTAMLSMVAFGSIGGNACASLKRKRVQPTAGEPVAVPFVQAPTKWNPSLALTLKRGAPPKQWLPSLTS